MASSQANGIASTPAMSSHILWLKYQGTARSTASPGAQRVVTAAQKAWLQPEVMATSKGSMAAA